jgi:hypothetical protein
MHSRTILHKRILFSLISSLIALFAINQTSQAQMSGYWQPLGSHPQAAQQPATINGGNTVAQYLWSLKAWNGRLYAGYGDYGQNAMSFIGAQFAITPFDPQTGTFASSPAFQFNAEAVPLYREIAGRLYAPNMDATEPGRSPRNFAVSPLGGPWAEHSEQLAVHIFDIATLNGTDVWMVGADCADIQCTQSNAVAWRSTDGGNTFQESMRLPLRDGFNVSRFYFAGVLHNRLYVQAVDESATTREVRSTSLVFDGSTWSDGPDLFPRRDLDPAAYGYQPTYFNNSMVYMTRFSYEADVPAKDLNVFNGINAWRVYLPQGIRNFTVDGSYIYVLAADGQVRRTTNITLPWAQWEWISTFTLQDTLRTNRKAGHSIAVFNGRLYIGTSQAELYRFSVTL